MCVCVCVCVCVCACVYHGLGSTDTLYHMPTRFCLRMKALSQKHTHRGRSN